MHTDQYYLVNYMDAIGQNKYTFIRRKQLNLINQVPCCMRTSCSRKARLFHFFLRAKKLQLLAAKGSLESASRRYNL